MGLLSNDLTEWLPATVGQVASLLGLALVLYPVYAVIYNLYFHPLRHFPGPLLQRASPLPWAYKNATGTQAFDTQRLHDKYGPVVRIGPNHLSFTDVRAWKDIYGHQVGTKLHTKDLDRTWPFYNVIKNPTSIITAPREEHQLLRRALSHGFSESSMRAQEPIISKYVDLLCQRLHERGDGGRAKLNMEAWFNWTTFDIVGDLVFGQAFGSLENVEYHPWVAFILSAVRQGATLISLGYIGLGGVIQPMVRLAAGSMKESKMYTQKLMKERLAVERSDDLFEGLLKRREQWNLSDGNLASNAFILVLAGSETTATTLSGATALLLTHPDALRKLQHEVRSEFGSVDEITMQSVNKLTYMLAVLNESLRLYPPVTSNLARATPAGGSTIAGHFVPEGTYVEVQHWAINHSKENWADPWEFRPERFMEDQEASKARGNNIESLQAFSIGPRNCIGRNLAYAEMRLILARLVYEFDLELADDSHDWIKRQLAYTLWDRIPLNVYLKPVHSKAGK